MLCVASGLVQALDQVHTVEAGGSSPLTPTPKVLVSSNARRGDELGRFGSAGHLDLPTSMAVLRPDIDPRRPEWRERIPTACENFVEGAGRCSGSPVVVEDGLAANGGSYCPSFDLLDDAMDDTVAAALGRSVTEGCPEPRAGETEPQWWAVTATAGVAADDAGYPAHGEDSQIVRLGTGRGVLMVTDQTAASALTTGDLLGGAAALVLSFDLDEVVSVEADWRRALLRKHVRSLTVELTRCIVGGGRVRGSRRARPPTRHPRRTGARDRCGHPGHPPDPLMTLTRASMVATSIQVGVRSAGTSSLLLMEFL